MFKNARLIVLLIGVAIIAGCLGGSSQGDQGYANPQALVNPAWVKNHLNDDMVKILEVGSNIDSYEEHIPGALFIDWRKDIADPDNPIENMVAPKEQIEELLSGLGIERDDTIVVYDMNGNVLAGRMYWLLRYYGHEDVRFMNGGKRQWQKMDYVLTADIPTMDKTDYIIESMNPEYRVTIDHVVGNLENPDVHIVDVRSPDQYSGKEPVAKRGGHIPGAVNVFWRQTLDENGLMKSPSELAELYKGRGIDGDKEIIVYCNTGVLSAYTWFVLHELVGYEDVRLYDASWIEWGNRDDTPIETV